MAHGGGIAGRLYRGEVSINFVGRQRLWYLISGLILLVSIVALLTRGLNFSEEFKGGSSFTFPASSATTQNEISRVVTGAGGGDATVQFTSSRLIHAVDGADGDPVHQRDPEGGHRARAGVPRHAEQHVDPARRPDLGRPDHQQGARGADHLPRGDRAVPVGRLRVADGRGGVRRADARHRDHDRRVRADRLLGQPDLRHRPADDPRLLALRHRGRLRQGAGEYRRPAHHPALHLQRRGQPGAQPDPGPVDQYLADRADSRRVHPVRRGRPARRGHAQGPGARAVRRHAVRHLLLDLHRDPGARGPQGAGAAVP